MATHQISEIAKEDIKLEKVLDLNPSLFYAYYLKEELRELWNQKNMYDTT
ncbi:hypothetical protein K5X82_01175 [Halosquirtibacter xylanolyticus]|nr:hypothetical protein K5X82_01175 [Prolixibacteraceae bacterium]